MQKLVDDNGIPKGLKKVFERDINTKTMMCEDVDCFWLSTRTFEWRRCYRHGTM